MSASTGADQSYPYRDAAQLYRDADWVAPIPVEGKSLPPTGWTGKTGGWPSNADIQAWVDFDGAKNIGLRLPPNVIGIDVDNYDGKPGAANLAAHIAMWGPLPDTWRTTSRTDEISGIRLFRIPENPDVQWESLIEGGGIELVRWDHRYAMVWPSIHPKTGRVYRWTKDNLVTFTNIPRAEELPYLPGRWILGLIKGRALDDHKVEIAGGTAFVRSLLGAADKPCRVMTAETLRAMESIRASGSRHDTMRDVLLSLIRVAESGHPGAMACINTLGEAYVELITDRDSRVKVTDEFVRALDGGAAIVAGARSWPQPRQDPCTVGTLVRQQYEPVPAVALQATGTDEPPPLHPLVQNRLDFLRADRQARALILAEDSPLDELPAPVSLREFLAIPDEHVTERISALLPIGARVVLAAQMKAGKTTLIGNLLRSLADGTPFLGAYQITPPTGSIALLDNEMDSRTLRRWLRDMKIENTDAVNLVPMIGKVGGFDLRIPRVFDYWVETLATRNTSVLVVDCLKPILDAMNLDERAETGKITTPLTRLKVEAGISELILVHHMGHSGERSRGDSALRGWPEVEWQLVRPVEQDEEMEMDAPRFLKAYGRDVNIPEMQLFYEATTRHLTIREGTRKDHRMQASEGRLQGLILNIVNDNPGINSTAITAQLKGQGGWGKKGAETRMLADLVHRSVLRMEIGDNGAKHYSLGPNAQGAPVE